MLHHHDKIERNSILLLILTVIVISIGGIVEIVPLFRIETTIEKVEGMRPYTPLELAGAKIYKREGCYGCHSQQVRVLRDEVERYGHYSIAAESMYDYPFQWGSKRTGPDLARLGGKYSDEWHTRHLINPRDVVPESIMPGYKFLINRDAQLNTIGDDMMVLRRLGVPYDDSMIQNAVSDAVVQASTDRDSDGLLKRYGKKVTIRDFDGNPQKVSEMDALVSYLQVLGTLVNFSNFEPIGYQKKSAQEKLTDQKNLNQVQTNQSSKANEYNSKSTDNKAIITKNTDDKAETNSNNKDLKNVNSADLDKKYDNKSSDKKNDKDNKNLNSNSENKNSEEKKNSKDQKFNGQKSQLIKK
ncbi:MAG: cytochrome-c oxidase, cbb3-type subunit [Pseudomonadota bacterium]|jgi:cytochrome c oxidase cbb3-type subunit 2